jgi:hypothetical protein
MRYIKKFESYSDYNFILESKLIFSDNFIEILNSVDHPISRTLKSLNNLDSESNNICFVDVKDKNSLEFIIDGNRKQPIRIGKMLNKLLDLLKDLKGLEDSIPYYSDKDKEDFTNKFKASLEYKNIDGNLDFNFEIYSGDDIYKYYSMIDYDKENGKGQLGKSCMNGKPRDFFDLYTKNPDKVSMLVLKRDGEMVGRCLLWKLDNGIKFMDRIYTYLDSDIDMFKKYGDDNDYWYKELQNTSYMNRDNFYYKFNIKNKNKTKSIELIVTLDNYDVVYYPYLDSLCYFNSSTGQLSNHRFVIDADLLVCNMDGGYKPSYFEWVF